MSLDLCGIQKQVTGIFIKVVKELIKEKSLQERCMSFAFTQETSAEDKSCKLGQATVSNCRKSEFFSNLLQNDEESHITRAVFLTSSYPKYPLYESFAVEMYDWVRTNQCPFLSKKSIALLNEETSNERRKALCENSEWSLKQIRDAINEFFIAQTVTESMEVSDNEPAMMSTLWDSTLVRVKYHVAELLEILQERGILYVLGLRETVGSVLKVPPASSKLIESFTKLQNDKSKLTVGARALSKHFHRCRNEWWGECKGSEVQKNEHALNVLQRIVHDCVWINIHMLPHDYEVIEIRCNDGYGARWTSNGSKFRGFLEPQMEDGHSVGWRH